MCYVIYIIYPGNVGKFQTQPKPPRTERGVGRVGNSLFLTSIVTFATRIHALACQIIS